MTLQDLGYDETLAQFRTENGLDSLMVGRVISEHRDRYIVKNEEGEYECELLGNLRFSAESRSDLPVVGDWVALSAYDRDKALIHAVFLRHSILARQAIGKFGEKQIIASNIDFGLIVQSVNRDFNINRLERYLTICFSSAITPIIVITKIDLVEQSTVDGLLSKIKERIKDVPIFAISNITGEGIEDFRKTILTNKTYCLLGSSGVGKSSLLNTLLEQNKMETGAINQEIDRGRHITTHRELIRIFQGGILIDNPGMREVGIADASEGMETTFELIYELANQCKFKDCSHTVEKGCAVLKAVVDEEISQSALDNYYKMEKEKAYFSSTLQEKRRKDRSLGKIYREIIQQKKKKKY
ncbi:MAG: ribosome small subunit-dependent GTPase A [Saprospiraceae bacterium]|nr:ribosome small subunit-dependent GTPase A [Saprospiraceae bacterium]